MSWTQMNLNDAFWFQEGPGVRKWQFRNEGIKLLNVGNIEKDGRLNLAKTDRCLSVGEATSKYAHFLVDEGDLIIASSGISIDADGFLRTRGSFVEAKDLPLCLNTSTIRFKALDGKSDLNFLRHWLQSREFRIQITKLVTGSAQLNFGPSHLKAIKINLPSLEEQQRIAAILDQAEELRAKRRAAIALLDQLPQAIFLEMFGDPVTNPMGWPKVQFSELATTRLGKMLDKKKQSSETPLPYLGNSNVQWFRFDTRVVQTMTFTEKERALLRLEPGDLLICEGGEPGRCAVWSGEIGECYFQKALHRARADRTKAIPHFLASCIFNLATRGGLKDHVTVATIAHLTGEKLATLQLPLPPLELQCEFKNRIEAIHRSKATHQFALAELDALFASLQNKAFDGGLN